jgi:hypothetical protein
VIDLKTRTFRRLDSLIPAMQSAIHVYEIRPRKEERGVDLISERDPLRKVFQLLT